MSLYCQKQLSFLLLGLITSCGLLQAKTQAEPKNTGIVPPAMESNSGTDSLSDMETKISMMQSQADQLLNQTQKFSKNYNDLVERLQAQTEEVKSMGNQQPVSRSKRSEAAVAQASSSTTAKSSATSEARPANSKQKQV